MRSGLSNYGNFVKIPYNWLKLCRKYPIPEEKRKNSGKEFVKINLNEICLLARIAGWNDNNLLCTETNADLADFLNVTPDAIKKYINELRMVGFIKTYEEKDSPVHTSKRTLYVQYDTINKMIDRFVQPGFEWKIKAENRLGTNVPSKEEKGTNIPSIDEVGTNVPSIGYKCPTNNTNNTNITNETIYAGKEENLPFGSFDETIDVNKLIFNSFHYTNKEIREAMDVRYRALKMEGYEDVTWSLISEFTNKRGTYGCMNNSAVESYAEYLVQNDLN